MTARRRVGRKQPWSNYQSLRCRLCLCLLCRGEGFRLAGYGTLCLACRGMIKAERRKMGLDQDMIDARDERSLAKAKCERDGVCRRLRDREGV